MVNPLLVGALVAAPWMGALSEPARTLSPGKAREHALRLPDLESEAFPGCVPVSKFDGIPSEVVVVTLQAEQQRMDFDVAWSQVERGASLWVIGACA